MWEYAWDKNITLVGPSQLFFILKIAHHHWSVDRQSKNIVEVSKNRANNVTKALTIIYSLQVSLDFEKTPEIAKSFFQIYEYCRQQIIKALTQKIKSGLEKSIKVMEEILDGWLEIGLERKNNA